VADLSELIGVVVLIVSVLIGGFSLFLLRGRATPGAVVQAFLQVTLIPERRRQFLTLVAAVVLCFLLTGVLFGLYELGVRLSSDADLPLAISFLAGMFALGGLAWVGLSPRTLTESEKTAAEADAPKIVQSLWMVPYNPPDPDRPPPARR